MSDIEKLLSDKTQKLLFEEKMQTVHDLVNRHLDAANTAWEIVVWRDMLNTCTRARREVAAADQGGDKK